MGGLGTDQRDWEELAALDAQWAILSASDRKHGRWVDDEFFATGARDIAATLQRMERFELPAERRSALDFGCGVGRMTRALSAHFDEAVGVDISRGMVAGATELNASVPNVRFVANAEPDLRCFDSDSFDLAFSFIALQHVSSRDAIRSYIAEFVRVVRPGGLVAFHLPSRLSLRYRVQPQRRAYSGLRRLGVPPATLYSRLRLQPMHMSFLPVSEVVGLLTAAGARMLEVDSLEWIPGHTSTTYYAAT